MKSLLITFIILFGYGSLFAQGKDQIILNDYLQIKNALVGGDSKSAATFSQNMIDHIGAENTNKDFKNLQKIAGKIVSAKDIEHQRREFSDFSNILWYVVKHSQDIDTDLYYEYCPMKKAYWLSNSPMIENPYYGDKMLDCGVVKGNHPAKTK